MWCLHSDYAHSTYHCQMCFCDELDVLILNLLAAAAGTFHYSDGSMVAQAKWQKIKRKEKETSFPPTPTWCQYSIPRCGDTRPSPTRMWGAVGTQHIAESSCRVSLSQMLLTATSVLPLLPQRCWFSHCVNCALWQARETDAGTFYISNLFLFFFFNHS